jgi:hypothetical protein
VDIDEPGVEGVTQDRSRGAKLYSFRHLRVMHQNTPGAESSREWCPMAVPVLEVIRPLPCSTPRCVVRETSCRRSQADGLNLGRREPPWVERHCGCSRLRFPVVDKCLGHVASFSPSQKPAGVPQPRKGRKHERTA